MLELHLIGENAGYYEPSSWDVHKSTTERLKKGYDRTQDLHDFGAYLPDPDEIRNRIKMMEWLRDLGLDDDQMNSIMISETPPFSMVQSLVKSFGKRRAVRRINSFLKV